MYVNMLLFFHWVVSVSWVNGKTSEIWKRSSEATSRDDNKSFSGFRDRMGTRK